MQLTWSQGLGAEGSRPCLGYTLTSRPVHLGASQGPTWGKKGTRRGLSKDVPENKLGKLGMTSAMGRLNPNLLPDVYSWSP